MSDKPRAIIAWVPPEAGGRQHVPAGPRYITVCRFEEDPGWENGTWSLVVEWVRTFRGGRLILANVDFLVPEAPTNFLRAGTRFELLEGRKRVAKGVILPPSVQVPEEVSDFELALVG